MERFISDEQRESKLFLNIEATLKKDMSNNTVILEKGTPSNITILKIINKVSKEWLAKVNSKIDELKIKHCDSCEYWSHVGGYRSDECKAQIKILQELIK